MSKQKKGTNSHKNASGNFTRSRITDKYYSHGSHAAKIEEQRDDVSLKYYGKLVKIENKKVATGSVAKIFCVCVVCFFAIVTVFARSIVYNYQLENAQLKNKLEEEKYETETVIAQSSGIVDIAYIEEMAKTKLNMAKPQSYQIVYIEVPKTDYTVVHEPSLLIEKEKFSFGTVKNIVGNIKATDELFNFNKGDSEAKEEEENLKKGDSEVKEEEQTLKKGEEEKE